MDFTQLGRLVFSFVLLREWLDPLLVLYAGQHPREFRLRRTQEILCCLLFLEDRNEMTAITCQNASFVKYGRIVRVARISERVFRKPVSVWDARCPRQCFAIAVHQKEQFMPHRLTDQRVCAQHGLEPRHIEYEALYTLQAQFDLEHGYPSITVFSRASN
jgi:hypothetical protein